MRPGAPQQLVVLNGPIFSNRLSLILCNLLLHFVSFSVMLRKTSTNPEGVVQAKECEEGVKPVDVCIL